MLMRRYIHVIVLQAKTHCIIIRPHNDSVQYEDYCVFNCPAYKQSSAQTFHFGSQAQQKRDRMGGKARNGIFLFQITLSI